MPVARVPKAKARARVMWRVARGLRGEAQTARLRHRTTEADVLDSCADAIEWFALAEWDEQIPGQSRLDFEAGFDHLGN